MIMEFGQYKIDVDVLKTRQFYTKAEYVSKSCSCDGCLNFEKAASILSQSVTTVFADLGVDLRKVCECYVHFTNEDGTLLYGGFCHVCGTLLSVKSAWKKVDDRISRWDGNATNATFAVSPDLHISFQEDISLLESEFPMPVIQLEFLANIPWVLDKENTYL